MAVVNALKIILKNSYAIYSKEYAMQTASDGRIPPLLQGLSLASRSVTHSIGTPMTHGIQAS